MFDKIDDFKKNFDWINKVQPENFESAALTIFKYQSANNPIYKAYIEAIGVQPNKVKRMVDIPFLPINFFKTHKVLCQDVNADIYFESSGTTSTTNSRHYLVDTDLYRSSFLHHFHSFYGNPEDYIFFCLLPSYLERNNSSLVFMADELIKRSTYPESAFYLNEWEKLSIELEKTAKNKQKALLLGVTFALLDFSEAYPMDLSDVIVMETGGMKGRREEWTRHEIHDFLKEKWNLENVHSEYGMTELFSQAYSKGKGIYYPGNTMKISIRDRNDPLSNFESGSGCLNIIDLANIFTCSFIATEDMGKVHTDGSFEIYGRMDYSALRGCSLMAV